MALPIVDLGAAETKSAYAKARLKSAVPFSDDVLSVLRERVFEPFFPGK